MHWKFLQLLSLGVLFSSCEVDTIIDSYQDRWQLNLTGVLSELNNGSFSGLSALDNGSFIVLREILVEDFSSEIAVFKISNEGDILGTQSSILEDQNIDIQQSAKNIMVDFHGQSPLSSDLHSFLSISDKLEFESSTVDLSLELSQLVPSSNYLSPEFLYVSGINLNKLGYSIVKIGRNGQSEWKLEFDEKPVDFFEGTNEKFFILSGEEDGDQIAAINPDGSLNWSVKLKELDKETQDFKSAQTIVGSPSNTIAIIGADQLDNLSIVFIDPKGKFIFQHSYRGFSVNQFQDFIVTSDGAFMMILSDVEISDNPSFTVFKLNHRAGITWSNNYILDELPKSVELIELQNRDVVILTSDGNLFLIADL